MKTTKPISPDMKALMNTTPPTNPLNAVPHLTDKQIQAIAAKAGFKLPKEVMAKIAELDVAHQTALDGMMRHTYDRAREAFSQQAETLKNAAKSGDNLSERDGWTREDFQEDFVIKMKAFKQEMIRVSEDAIRILLPHFDRFAALAEQLSMAIEKNDAAIHSELGGIAYRPSAAALACLKASETVRNYKSSISPRCGLKPSKILGWVPIITN